MYESLSGNTRKLAEMIKDSCESQGINPSLQSISTPFNPEEYDLIFLGSYTWGEGKTPNKMIEFLRYLLKDNQFTLPPFAIFGTGDTQWTHFCRAVDEMKYHLSKQTKVLSTVKLEQNPSAQTNKINQFVNETMEGLI